MKIISIYKLILVALLCGAAVSCNDDTSPEDAPKLMHHITFVCPLGGLGDNGYNDMILRGVMRSYEALGYGLSIVYPDDKEQVSELISDFCNSSLDGSNLLLLADNSYASLLRKDAVTAPKNGEILIADEKSDDFGEGVKSFYINRYGAFYLAGKMAAPHRAACVIAAMPGDARLDEAIRGFKDGYGKETDVEYLADDSKGYDLPDKAYRIAAQYENSFIIPLAGGSNSGVYKYSREKDFYLSLVAGIDTDCQSLSHRVPFSIVISIDRIMESLITDWYNGGLDDTRYTFGLADGAVDIVVSELFPQWSYIWEDYYLDDAYWINAYSEFKNEAIEKEAEYENH